MKAFFQAAGWLLLAAGLALSIYGLSSDVTVQTGARYLPYGGYVDATRTVNFHRMFAALACLLSGGFAFVTGGVFLATSALVPSPAPAMPTHEAPATVGGNSPGAAPERGVASDVERPINPFLVFGGVIAAFVIVVGFVVILHGAARGPQHEAAASPGVAEASAVPTEVEAEADAAGEAVAAAARQPY